MKMTFFKNELKILKSFVEEFTRDESIIKNFSCMRKKKIFVLRCNLLKNKQVLVSSSSEFVEFSNVNKSLQVTYEDGNKTSVEDPKGVLKTLLRLLKTIDSNNLFITLKDELTIEDCIELSKGVRSVFSKKEEVKSTKESPSVTETITESPSVTEIITESSPVTEIITEQIVITPVIIAHNQEDKVYVNFNVEYDKKMADIYKILQEVLGNISFVKCKSITKVIRCCIKFCVDILNKKGISDSDLESKIIEIYREKGLLSCNARPKWNKFTVFSDEVRKNKILLQHLDKKQVSDKISSMWKNLSENEKDVYKTLADKRNKQ